MPVNFSGSGEPEGSLWNVVAMIWLVILAYLSVPRGLSIPHNVWYMLGFLGVVAYFGFSFLLIQPARYLTIRTIALLLIGAGIFASPNFISWGLALTSISISRERSIAVSTVLLSFGLATLTAYWILNFVDRRGNPDMERRLSNYLVPIVGIDCYSLFD